MSDVLSPLNEFESRGAQAQRGELAIKEVLASLASAELASPSATAVQEDWSGFQPLLFSKSGVSMLACFSAKERLADYVDMAPYCLVIKGAELLRRIPAGHGLVVNPGQPVGFDVSPEGIAQMVTEFICSRPARASVFSMPTAWRCPRLVGSCASSTTRAGINPYLSKLEQQSGARRGRLRNSVMPQVLNFEQLRADGNVIPAAMTVTEMLALGWGPSKVVALRWSHEGRAVEYAAPNGAYGIAVPGGQFVAAILDEDPSGTASRLVIFSADGTECGALENSLSLNGIRTAGRYVWFEAAMTPGADTFGVVFQTATEGEFRCDVEARDLHVSAVARMR